MTRFAQFTLAPVALVAAVLAGPAAAQDVAGNWVGVLEAFNDFMRAEEPDFVEINYSIMTPHPESRRLTAMGLGIGVIAMQPFQDGAFLCQVSGRELPGWASEFCERWAQFCLKSESNEGAARVLAEPAPLESFAVNRAQATMDTSHARPRDRVRWPFTQLLCLLALSAVAHDARAHPAPFSYLDLHLDVERTGGTLVIHDFDAAYELRLEDPQALLEPGVARERADELLAIVVERLRIVADGEPATLQWRPVEVLPERQSLSFAFTLTRAARPGRIEIDAVLFPYDPVHQTFINVYETGLLTRQAILDANASRFEHFAGTTQGRWAVVRTFVVSGVEHILIGPDHLLFLLGLLLLGGSLWRLATIVTAFTLGHSVTLSLAALDLVRVAPALVEPAIALSIVVVGVDNLLVRQRRVAEPQSAAFDLRPWLAVAFGLIHGFGFAAVLREVGLPPGALGWSLAAFNVGVEVGQLTAVAVAVALLAAVRRYDVVLAERCVVVGSVGVIAAGVYWFAQRVGFIA